MEKKHEIYKRPMSNIVLVGASIDTLQAIGLCLAQKLGYGCLNLEAWLEVTHKKSLPDLLQAEDGGSELVEQAIADVKRVLNHVILISVRLWQAENLGPSLKNIGSIFFLDFPVKDPVEPDKQADSQESVSLFSELSTYLKTKKEEKKQFSWMTQQSEWICRSADFIVNDQYSTSEEVARCLKLLLVKKNILKFQKKG